MAQVSSSHKEKAALNFKKAQSLLAKIITMAEADKYCIDIVQQNLAVIGLLKSANQLLMEGHLKNCFSSAILAKNQTKQTAMVDEILRVSRLSSK